MATTLETGDTWPAAVRALRSAGPRSVALPRLPDGVDLPLRRDDVVVVGTVSAARPATHWLPGLSVTVMATRRVAVVGSPGAVVVSDEPEVVAGVHAYVAGLGGTTLVTPALLEAGDPTATGRLLIADGQPTPVGRPRRGPVPTYVVERRSGAPGRPGDLVVERSERADGHVLLHPPALVVGDGLLRRRLDREPHTLAVATESFRVLGLPADFSEREVRDPREREALHDLWSLEQDQGTP